MGLGEPQKFERLLPVFLVGVIQNTVNGYPLTTLAKGENPLYEG